MTNKKQTIKEESKKRDTSTDVAIMVACIMDTLEKINNNIKQDELVRLLTVIADKLEKIDGRLSFIEKITAMEHGMEV